MWMNTGDIQAVKLWLVQDIMYGYAEFRNVRPKAPGYSLKLRPHRFVLCTRPGFKIKDVDIWARQDCDDAWLQIWIDWWMFYDHMIIDDVEYYMWISDDEETIKIFASKDWCNLYQIIDDCFCPWGFKEFQVVDFLKGTPKYLYTDNWVVVDDTDWWCATQNNYDYTQLSNWLADLADDAVTAGTYDRFFNAWPTSIQPGDRLYVYDRCEGQTQSTPGICWQYNQIQWINQNWNLEVADYWAWFNPGVIDSSQLWTWAYISPANYPELEYWGLPPSYYLDPPQMSGANMQYMVFPDYGETFAYQSCDWVKVFHDYIFDEDRPEGFENNFDNCEATVTTLCNFTGCYQDALMYTGQNWAQHSVYYDATTGVALYSQPGQLWYLWAGNYVQLRQGIKVMTTFQNYVTYFWADFIWAFYIGQQLNPLTNIPTYTAQWNIVRQNLWIRCNPDGRSKAYDEYENWFVFLGSNKRLYTLSIVANESWLLTSRLENLTDDDWGKWIIWDLEAIQKWDSVAIDWDEDRFRIVINGSNNNSWINHKTKVLTFWKRRNIRTIDTSCCAVFCQFRDNIAGKEVMLWNAIYHECWHRDCIREPINRFIRSYLFEDEVTLTKENSFNMHTLAFIKTQMHDRYQFLWGTELYVEAYKNWVATKMIAEEMHNLPYFSLIEDIKEWVEPVVSQCMLDSLKWCEVPKTDECKDRPIDYNVDLFACPRRDWLDYSCHCPPERIIDDYCFCYDQKKYFMAPFINIYSDMNNIKWEMYKIELRGVDDMCFGWRLIWYRWFRPDEEVAECSKWGCKCDGWEETWCCIVRNHYGCF